MDSLKDKLKLKDPKEIAKECQSFLDDFLERIKELWGNLQKKFPSSSGGGSCPEGGRPGKQWYDFYGDRPMKYPYTFTAKVVQMPFAHYIRHNWYYRYYTYGLFASLPVFFYLERLSKSPESRKKWAEVQRKEHEEYAHKFD